MIFDQPIVYACKHKNEEIRMNSRSGGFFTALSNNVLNQSGIVYGCILDEKFNAKHIRCTTKEDRDRMRGSKYVQSKLGDTFSHVKCDLEEGRKVLFTGTPCQVEGLRKYLGKDFSNLVLADVICFGVPSPKVWNSYLKWQENRIKKPIIRIDFRNKVDYGWHDHVETIFLKDGSQVDSRIYTDLFQKYIFLRPVCYKCPFKSIHHNSDISMADFWGIDKIAPDFDDNKGVSLILVNSIKGKEIFEDIKEEFDYFESSTDACMQPSLKHAIPSSTESEKFWNDYHTKSFDSLVRVYWDKSISNRIKNKIKRIIRGNKYHE